MFAKNVQELISSPENPVDSADLYESAFSLYEKSDYGRAKPLFSRLVFTHPHEPSFWKGLAACAQMLESYEEALRAWATFSLLSYPSSEGHIHASDCLTALGQTDEAQKAKQLAQTLREKRK